jgi:predicted dehydrogenase
MSAKKVHRIGVIMNGVTGRMGLNQHLSRSILAIRQQGGIALSDQEVILPEPLLVGRNAQKLNAISKEHGDLKWTTDLKNALADKTFSVYFDAQTTERRAEAVLDAIQAGKHVYCEKPTATNFKVAYDLYKAAQNAGVKHGVVQDKLWLPGLRKLQTLKDLDFFGEIYSVRGEFGYWVFEGEHVPPQRPSWNYRKEDGGGMILDMLCHWRYVLDNLFGGVQAVSCLGATHVKRRWDEAGREYQCTADDSAYASFRLSGGIIAHFNCSWCTRVRRDDLLTLQVDGSKGSAVAGLRHCWTQHYGSTPRPVWNPDTDTPLNYFEGWQKVPEQQTFDNAFKTQWEMFLRRIVIGEPFKWNLLEGAKGVQLAEKGLESWEKRCWIDLPPV